MPICVIASNVSPIATPGSSHSHHDPEPGTPTDKPKDASIRLPPESHFEIAGFFLKGKYPNERLSIEAMDVLYFPELNRRFIPLLTILRSLQIEFSEENKRIRFKFFNEYDVSLDPKRKAVQVGDQEHSIELAVAISEITQKEDIFVPPEVIATILSMEIKWNDTEYAFQATTNRELDLWKHTGFSLSEIDEMIVNLPELLPPAVPSGFSLDYLQFESVSRADMDRSDNLNYESASLAYMRETLSGGLFNGRYQLRLRQPRFIVDQTGIHSRDSSPLRLEKANWTHRFSNAAMVVGDTGIGLNSLVFPGVGLTGFRFSGLTGQTTSEQIPKILEGQAITGSAVELYINNRKVGTQEVFSDILSPKGKGRYRFENIYFRTGAINTIRLVVNEPNGVRKEEEKTIYVNPNLIEKNRLRYSTGFGTTRPDDVMNMNARGVFSGAHADYGVSDSLTVGVSMGYQNSIYRPNTLNPSDPFDRHYPENSFHVGSNFVWQPFTRVFFSGDLAGSMASSMGGGDLSPGNDLAVNLSGSFFPAEDIVLRSRLFKYGDNFFNGNNRYLHGQQGFDVSGSWRFHPRWSIGASLGQIWSGAMNEIVDPLAFNYQSVDITTTQIPRTSMTLSADRSVADWEDGNRTLYTLKLVSHPFLDLAFEGKFAIGDATSPIRNRNLIRDLNLSGLALFDQPLTSAAVSKSLNEQSRVRVGYDERSNGNFREATLLHEFKWDRFPLEMSTRVGYDLASHTPIFQNLIRYPLGWLGRKSIGLQTGYRRNRWSVSLQFNLFELFTTMGNGIQRISNQWTSRDSAGVKGRVFLDINANARLDPGEPGVDDVRVLVNGKQYSAVTDRRGYFVVTGLDGAKKAQVALDIETVPAIYAPTNGRQTAIIRDRSLTELNLGLIPVNFIEGYVTYIDPKYKERKPLGGVRVFITREADDEAIIESYTAGDGSYYLQDIRPGNYSIQVDPETLPSSRYILKESARSLEIHPSTEPQEFKLSDFIVLKTARSAVKKK